MEYNLYLLAIPKEQDTNTGGILAQLPVKYALAATTDNIDDEYLCKMMKEMYHRALEVQNDI